MLSIENALLVVFIINFHGSCAQGTFDPCYFWSGAVYAGSGMCFLYVKDPAPFGESQAACEADGATLAEVRTLQQKDMVERIAASSGAVWLGAVWNSSFEGNFTWLSDQSQVSAPLEWWSGSVVPQIYLGDLCMLMTRTSGLAGKDCADPVGYICQTYAGNPCDTFLPGAEYYDSSCFLSIPEEMTLQEAQDRCEKRQAFVTEPSKKLLVKYLISFAEWFLDPEQASWLGLTMRNTGTLEWVSSGVVISSTNWARDEPGIAPLTADDAVVMNGTDNWLWRRVSKYALAQVVCQRDLADECIGLFFLGKCFNLYEDAISWDDARDDCISEGSYLVEPKTELLARALEKYSTETSKITLMWLGAQDIDTEGSFIWDHSRQLLVNTYTDWTTGEPNNMKDMEHVVVWRRNKRWNDAPRNSSAAYMCEREFFVYFHSYVLVLPKEAWGGHTSKTRAFLSVTPHPGLEGDNLVEISTFSTDKFEMARFSATETFQYKIDPLGLFLNSSGLQHKYVLVRSQYPLDVLFYFQGATQYVCSSLILEHLPLGQSSSFFPSPRLGQKSIGIVSTSETPASLTVSFSTFHAMLSFSFNGMDVLTRNTLVLSASMPEQYQSLYVDSLSNTGAAPLAHSTGPLAVFNFGREDWSWSRDITCDQVLPTSMVGSHYITFPSLPMDPANIDYFTVVAVHRVTKITAYDADNALVVRQTTLWWAGDSIELELPASGFYYINGTSPFYLYARITGKDPNDKSRSGLCSLTLFHESLFRDSYTVAVVGPLAEATSVYVIAIVRTLDSEFIEIESGWGTVQVPDLCQDVNGTEWSGCYFRLVYAVSGAVYRVQMALDGYSVFGAYLFARLTAADKLLCSQLGLPSLLRGDLEEEYDYPTYEKSLKSKPICPTTPTTAAPITTTINATSEQPPPDCGVSTVTAPASLTNEELEEALEEITTRLTVKKAALSSVKRTKVSAPDQRASSTSMGYFSLSFIGVFLGLVIESPSSVFTSEFGRVLMELCSGIPNIRESNAHGSESHLEEGWDRLNANLEIHFMCFVYSHSKGKKISQDPIWRKGGIECKP
ncbi:hypothetical protein RRG08_060104 [Elysia crispata]|uniref:C-type lectin domain-containing protein n=1 Tax=Elysia crispata TaxID=231223 RepID=A0AAE1EDP3_9GAST|nr:hypothetical protein RRG08_060104 [Elysia crispata]